MKEEAQLQVIVPETKGIDRLSHIIGIKTTLVQPGEDIPTDARLAEILVVGPAEQQHEVDQALRQIAQLPELKLLATLGQGTEQWDGLLPDGLRLVTARGAHGGSTAELVMTLLLALVRELPNYIENQQRHAWQGRRAQTLMNMSVLIYGASDLGRNVQKRLQPFGARITMVGAHAHDDVIDTNQAYAMLPHTDAVILALPLTPDTKHIADADFLAALPDDAIIINTGRGGLIDQDALVKELKSGRLQAGLDVMTPEPLPQGNELWDMPGLVLTPHIGGNTEGADDRAWRIVAAQIEDYLRGTQNV